MQLHHGLAMRLTVGMHGIDHAQIIGVFGDIVKEFRNPQAALTPLLELPRRFHQPQIFLRRLLNVLRRLEWQSLTVFLIQTGFVIERIHMTRTAMHKQEDDPFGAWLEVRRF